MKKCIMVLLILFVYLISGETVKIGAYDNPPKIFMDSNGKLAGFWYDITMKVAENENWDVKWEYGSWDECLKRLERNEIDIMVDTGVTPERQTKFIFNNETVYLSWTKIYKNKTSVIESILDLEGKNIGGLKNSFDLEGPDGLRKILRDFQINANIVELGNYKDVFSYIENGSLDAGIVDKDFGSGNESYYKIDPTTIILQPARMQYAFCKTAEKAEHLKDRIDFQMIKLKADKGSVYYYSFNFFFGNGKAEKFYIPGWVWILLISIMVILMMFAIFNRLLRIEVKKKTASLKEKEENLRVTLASIGDGVIATDIEGKITLMNKTAEKLTGWSAKNAEGKEIKEVFRIINAQTRKEVLNPIEIVIKDGRTVGLANHTVLISKEGREYQISDSAAPIMNSDGSIIGMILVFSDVTEKYAREQKIVENERFLNSLISNLKGMVYRCNHDEWWTMIFMSRECFELTGYYPEDFINNGRVRYSDIICETDRDAVRKAVDECVISKEHFVVEYRITDAEGKQKWVLEKGRGVYDENGNLRFLEGFITDITVSKTAELEIRAKTDELERSNSLMTGREKRMIGLKKEINDLLSGIGKEPRYKITGDEL